jgi:hypothetical protein
MVEISWGDHGEKRAGNMGKYMGHLGIYWGYPLVNCHITMENHHFQWINPL